MRASKRVVSRRHCLYWHMGLEAAGDREITDVDQRTFLDNCLSQVFCSQLILRRSC